MRTNAIPLDWLQKIFEYLGDIGIIYSMVKWAYKHWAQVRKFSFVVVLGVGIGIMILSPPTISHVSQVPVGRFTSNLGAYGPDYTSYQGWMLSFWIPFLALSISSALIMVSDSYPMKAVLSRMFHVVKKWG